MQTMKFWRHLRYSRDLITHLITTRQIIVVLKFVSSKSRFQYQAKLIGWPLPPASSRHFSSQAYY